MPTHDGGHYYLTVLAPIRTGTMSDPLIKESRSHEHILAQKLALMPTGRQTAASPHDAPPSPFAGNILNHFARFVIIDGPTFNGRVSEDTLVAAVEGVNPLTPQPVDRLSTPYLLFSAEIDAPGDGETALRAYTSELWATMRDDLEAIFHHCVGFESVASPGAFHGYIKACQVETTMPFNDYWADDLKFKAINLPLGAIVSVARVVGLVGLAAWLLALVLDGVFVALGMQNELAKIAAAATGWGALVVVGLLILAAILAYGAYRFILGRGMQPFATPPDSDLQSVLKGLFLQQHFTRFVIDAQAQPLDDAQLYDRFGAFLAAVEPASGAPTQAPGQIRAPELTP
jgi:hypothetical protein